MLKEFWFPVLLAIFGGILGVAGTMAEGVPRRVWWSLTLVVFCAAALSYIWGDPVRGPFYGVTHPGAKDEFRFHCGTVAFGYPIKNLRDGIDFSSAIKLGGQQPIMLKVRRSWWAGWKCDLALKFPEGTIYVMKDNRVSPELPPNWDINFDDHAIEIVNEQHVPFFQLVQDGAYDMHVNALLTNSQQKQVVIINDSGITWGPIGSVNASDLPQRIFKYPSYAHHGDRE